MQPAIQKIGMRAQIRAHVANVAPVAIQHAAIHPAAFRYQAREQFATEIAGLSFGNEGKNFRF